MSTIDGCRGFELIVNYNISTCNLRVIKICDDFYFSGTILQPNVHVKHNCSATKVKNMVTCEKDIPPPPPWRLTRRLAHWFLS